jgi:hypothetical protein
VVFVPDAEELHVVGRAQLVDDTDLGHVHEVGARIHLVVFQAELVSLGVPDLVDDRRDDIFLTLHIERLFIAADLDHEVELTPQHVFFPLPIHTHLRFYDYLRPGVVCSLPRFEERGHNPVSYH